MQLYQSDFFSAPNIFQISFITSQVTVVRKKNVLSSEDIILFFTKLI